MKKLCNVLGCQCVECEFKSNNFKINRFEYVSTNLSHTELCPLNKNFIKKDEQE